MARYVVTVAVSLEEVDDSTDALVPPLLVGLPLLLLVVGGTTWMVRRRALAPVERIRREVDADHRRPARPAGARAALARRDPPARAAP